MRDTKELCPCLGHRGAENKHMHASGNAAEGTEDEFEDALAHRFAGERTTPALLLGDEVDKVVHVLEEPAVEVGVVVGDVPLQGNEQALLDRVEQLIVDRPG